MGPKLWLRGARALLKGHSLAKPRGDVRQMPGAFLVRRGEIVRAHYAEHSADHPDLAELATFPG
jgi:hypothetical protein